MDQSSFGILAHNYLRTHNLVLVAHMSKHMKFKWLREAKSKWILRKCSLISEKKVTVALLLFCMKVKKRCISTCNMKSLWLSVWAGQQIKEKYQNGCHLKLKARITKYLMCILGGYVHVCTKYEVSV